MRLVYWPKRLWLADGPLVDFGVYLVVFLAILLAAVVWRVLGV